MTKSIPIRNPDDARTLKDLTGGIPIGRLAESLLRHAASAEGAEWSLQVIRDHLSATTSGDGRPTTTVVVSMPSELFARAKRACGGMSIARALAAMFAWGVAHPAEAHALAVRYGADIDGASELSEDSDTWTA